MVFLYKAAHLVSLSVSDCLLFFPTELTDEVNVNCISTFEGVYQFTYEVKLGGGGICDNSESQIRACQDPGSKYVDNQVFRMIFAKCRDVSTSYNKRKHTFISCFKHIGKAHHHFKVSMYM